ncbi:MAG: MarR family transcriptional regulator [Terriglobia bacterium]
MSIADCQSAIINAGLADEIRSRDLDAYNLLTDYLARRYLLDMHKRLNEFPYISSAAAPDQRTAFLLQRAHQWTNRTFNEALRTLQIDTPHFEVLSALAACEALTQTQMARCLDIDRSVIVGIVNQLERLGLAQRHPIPRNRLAHTAQITREGRQRLYAAQKIAVPAGGKIFAGLSQSEREQLDRTLLHIIRNG